MEPCGKHPVTPTPPGLLEFGARAERRITELLDGEIDRWSEVDRALVPPLAALRELVTAGGKRLRPAFCSWAFVGAGGDPTDPRVDDVGAALELLHAFALVHDDVMDGSARRRGRPSVHTAFGASHRAADAHGEARRFGEGAAILVGDFAFVYADRLFASAPPAARPVFDELRVELCVGQFLDLAGSAGLPHAGSGRGLGRGLAQAELIERYKSGKYTVERPMHLGAALAGRLDELEAPLSAFGVPLGQAFQLRDDLLGAFGDPEVTGKPVGDDLRERKLTPLVASGVARDPAIARAFDVDDDRVDDAWIADVQARLVHSGAVAEVEERIAAHVRDALEALDRVDVTDEARAALVALAHFVAWRDR